jgi:glycosyltransferase involved in cell wall biosynthesis
MKKVTIILPAYNEEASFQLIRERMGQVVKQNPSYDWSFFLSMMAV